MKKMLLESPPGDRGFKISSGKFHNSKQIHAYSATPPILSPAARAAWSFKNVVLIMSPLFKPSMASLLVSRWGSMSLLGLPCPWCCWLPPTQCSCLIFQYISLLRHSHNRAIISCLFSLECGAPLIYFRATLLDCFSWLRLGILAPVLTPGNFSFSYKSWQVPPELHSNHDAILHLSFHKAHSPTRPWEQGYEVYLRF